VDALGCQKDIAQAIVDEQADSVLRVKTNQEHLYQDLEDWFAYAQQTNFQAMNYSQERVVNCSSKDLM
jgi:predicted transposase YbfD/YdcC